MLKPVFHTSSNLPRCAGVLLLPLCACRTWAFVTGAALSTMVLVPSMRNMRLFSLFTLFTTTFTSIYMASVSLKQGLSAEAARQPPRGPADVFSAFSNTLFAFGSHCMLL